MGVEQYLHRAEMPIAGPLALLMKWTRDLRFKTGLVPSTNLTLRKDTHAALALGSRSLQLAHHCESTGAESAHVPYETHATRRPLSDGSNGESTHA